MKKLRTTLKNKTSNITLVLFTSLFPYEGGEAFLENEIKYLSSAFKKIIIVPTKKTRKRRKLQNNVEVDNTIADSKTRYFYKIKSLFGKYFRSNITLNFNELKYLFKNAIYVENIKRWIINFLTNNNVELVLFYSYWFEAPTAALTLAKFKYPNLKFVTRVHGGDLYEHLYGLEIFPFRQKIISNITHVFPISEIAINHLLSKYNFHKNKITVSRLGVMPTNTLTKSSSDKKLRIVSCSNLIPIKRIDLLITALALIKDKEIIWTHIGDGELKNNLEILAKTKLANNIQYKFLGYLENREVLNYYKTNPVDIFINVSSSEGIPVSIMEAQSFGIPVIATDVGGTKEIVNNENGLLLKSNPTSKDILNALLNVIENKNFWQKKRQASFNTWKTKFNAENNYKNFINNLAKIL